MKAVVKYARGVGNVELREVPEPEPGPGQVKIEVKACGVCGTDLHIYHDEYPNEPPIILGHELSGVVAECGPGASDRRPGERVTTRTFYVTCGKCRYCLTGKDNLCAHRRSIGSGVNGGMAKYVIVPEKGVLPLPENVSFPAGALSEPLACTVHAVLDANRPMPGDTVLVTGPGAIGLLAFQLAKAAGAEVTVLGTPGDWPRLELAKRLGAHEVATTEQLPELEERCRGGGFDVVLEASGAAGGVEAGLKLIRKGGRYTQIGLFGKKIAIDMDLVVLKEVEVTATFAHVWSAWPRALALMSSGAVQAEPLVSHRYPLSEWRQAFDTFASRDGVKVLLQPE